MVIIFVMSPLRSKIMTPEEYDRVKVLDYRTKRGLPLSSEEYKFISFMYEIYPEEYKRAQEEGMSEAMREINPLME